MTSRLHIETHETESKNGYTYTTTQTKVVLQSEEDTSRHNYGLVLHYDEGGSLRLSQENTLVEIILQDDLVSDLIKELQFYVANHGLARAREINDTEA